MYKTLLQSQLPMKRAAKYYPGARQRRGSFLIETSISIFLLSAIAIVLLDASFNILKPRVWTMKTNLVDAYLSQEVALMNSLDFEDIADGTDDAGERINWGDGATSTAVFANAVQLDDVVMGKMPGFTAGADNGRDYPATVFRVRVIPDTAKDNPTTAADFIPEATGFNLKNTGVHCYELQTHVVYEIGGETYVKTRSVIRSQ